MSAQFGRWNLDGTPVDRTYLEKVEKTLTPHGPDGVTSFGGGNIAILYHSFYTTKESRSEVQPHICASGPVITWDGRLDNRADLVRELRHPLTVESTDLAIVASAYEKWGTECFGKLIGDWAFSIWNPVERSLVLAKDPIGTRHLYYSFDRDQITWSTVLDPVVLLAGRTLELNEEYIAGWLSMFPAAHLTPYVDVHSVPPSSLVFLGHGKHAVRKYWDFDPDKQLRYRSDAEYEENFRSVFRTAVQRRLRSDQPVLAELSGGRDSSSIVCMADEIIARGRAECPRLDTISYFDDAEPNWNERPYFTKVEEKRGRVGWHINVGQPNLDGESGFPSTPKFGHDRFLSTPGGDGRTSREIRLCIDSQRNRVVVSGVGGDEVMGGVPTPIPDLQDLLVEIRFAELARELKIWALRMKRTWFGLLWQTVREFIPCAVISIPEELRPITWLKPTFVKHHLRALSGYPSSKKLFGPLPSFQENTRTLDVLRRQLACASPAFGPPYERRYPYLDRNLLDFMFAIPPDQLVRPTQSRSLMRRALAGIVPDEILNRKVKAFVCRAPLLQVSRNWSRLTEMTQAMTSDFLGIVDSTRLCAALLRARAGEQIPIIGLMRTIRLEEWLRDLRLSGIVNVHAAQEAGPAR